MPTNKPKHILVAPLDWGLGHTTRCMPIISHLLSLGHIVTVAGNNSQKIFIEETFSGIDFIHLEGYNITYSRWNKLAQAGLLYQLPGIVASIKKEHNWLQKLVDGRQIDGIISDNRYGLYHHSVPSVILTHQLQVQSGFGSAADRAVQKIHYRLLERFGDIWVIDTPGAANLAGTLSHPVAMPGNPRYIGLLSRFAGLEKAHGEMGASGGEMPLVIMLSGPEPQRTELSWMLWRQACGHKGNVVFIAGSEAAEAPAAIPPHIAYHQRTTHHELLPLLMSARMVICRSGYSSIMDLIALGKKAVLIPTPGQTEQLYLARCLHDQGICFAAKQEGFNLELSLNEAEKFPYHTLPLHAPFQIYREVVEQWVGAF